MGITTTVDIRVNGEIWIPQKCLIETLQEVNKLRHTLRKAVKELKEEAEMAVEGSARQEHLRKVAFEFGVVANNLITRW